MNSHAGDSLAVAPYAKAYCRVALNNVVRAYPHKLDHILSGHTDLRLPSELHPVFYGSYDWHSSVHMHWLLARLLRLFPELGDAPLIHEVFNRHFVAERVREELAYVMLPANRAFERTYGWAWLLKLQVELSDLAASSMHASQWRDALHPLSQAIADRIIEFLKVADYPIRSGTHANSAFGLLFTFEYALQTQHLALRKLILDKAHQWYGRDRRYPASYEPGGDDFLSGGLVEAALMQRMMDDCSYADWWNVFCPPLSDLSAWLLPVRVSDRSDPKLSHLDGLNLSRAWCWKQIAASLPTDQQPMARRAIDAHLSASLPHVTGNVYAGTHWLASFAMLALTA